MVLDDFAEAIPVNDFKEFVEYVKSKPDQVMYGTSPLAACNTWSQSSSISGWG